MEMICYLNHYVAPENTQPLPFFSYSLKLLLHEIIHCQRPLDVRFDYKSKNRKDRMVR